MKRFYTLVILTAYAFNLKAMYHGGAIASSSSDAQPVTAASIAAAVPTTSTSTALSSSASEPKITIKGATTQWQLNVSDVKKCEVFKNYLDLKPDSKELPLPPALSDGAFKFFIPVLTCQNSSQIPQILEQKKQFNTLVAIASAADCLGAESIFDQTLQSLFEKFLADATAVHYFNNNKLPVTNDNPLTTPLEVKLKEGVATSNLFDYWAFQLQAQKLPIKNVYNIEWSPCGQFLIWQTNAWDLRHGQLNDLTGTQKTIAKKCTCFAVAPYRNLIAIGLSNEVYMINPQNPSKKLYTAEAASPLIISWSPNGERVIVCQADGTAFLWNILTGEEQDVQANSGNIASINWLDDHSFAMQCLDSTIELFDLTDQGTVLSSTMQGNADARSRFSSTYTKLCTHNGSTATVWDRDGQCVTTLTGKTTNFKQATLNCDGTLVATINNDNTVKIWDINGTCLQTLKLPYSMNLMQTLAWHKSDPLTLITIAMDDVILWNLDHEVMQTLREHNSVPQMLLYNYARYLIEKNMCITILNQHVRRILASLPEPLKTIMKKAIFQPQSEPEASAKTTISSSFSLPFGTGGGFGGL